MRRILIDGNVVDVILDTSGLFDQIQRGAAAGHVVIVKTHITRDELEQMPDTKIERRKALMGIYASLPGVEVPTEANALDHSRLGFRLDDGAHSGTTLTALSTSGRGKIKDALIGITAAGQADVLVTDDKKFAERVKASKTCEVWGSEEFISFVTEKSPTQNRGDK